MDSEMSFRTMNRKVFAGAEIPHPFFQPRMEPWFDWQKRFGNLPEPYREMSVREFYETLGLSMRYVHYYTDMPDPVVRTFSPDVSIQEEVTEKSRRWTYETPYGDLSETETWTVDGVWRTVEHPVKELEDLRAFRWLLERTEYTFSEENFAKGSEYLGDLGEPQFWVPKSPYQALAIQYMKLEPLIYALADAPDEVEATMEAIDAAYDPLYERLIESDMLHIVNFGENIDEQLLSPRYFEKYLIPFYEKRSNQLREHGIATHIHIDGAFHSLLPYLADLPFDGLESLTPEPQGNVSLEEIKEAVGDKVLLDVIPAVFFLPTYPRERLMETVERIVELFHPNLILGVSDEVPQGAEPAEAIERVRMIAEWCRGV